MTRETQSDWMRLIETESLMLVRGRMGAPWGMQIPPCTDMLFHIVTEGHCWLRRTGAPPLLLRAGDFVFLPEGVSHELTHHPHGPAQPLSQFVLRTATAREEGAMTTLVCGTYCAGAHLAKPMLRALPPVVHFPAAQVQGNPAFSALFQLLQDELEQSQQNSDALLHHLFDALFLYVLREWANKAASKPAGWLPGLHDTALATALARMHAEPGAPWTVQSLAHAAHLSRAAFARRFTEQVGEPPLTYLTRWRMEMAARLLRDTAAPLAEVARHVGYDSEFTFSRAFKRHQGQAPTAFRRTRHQSHRPAGTA